jgi:hypothetical protein
MSIRTQLQFISIENTVFHQLMFNVLVSKILANQKTDTEIEFHNFDFTIWVLWKNNELFRDLNLVEISLENLKISNFLQFYKSIFKTLCWKKFMKNCGKN